MMPWTNAWFAKLLVVIVSLVGMVDLAAQRSLGVLSGIAPSVGLGLVICYSEGQDTVVNRLFRTAAAGTRISLEGFLNFIPTEFGSAGLQAGWHDWGDIKWSEEYQSRNVFDSGRHAMERDWISGVLSGSSATRVATLPEFLDPDSAAGT